MGIILLFELVMEAVYASASLSCKALIAYAWVNWRQGAVMDAANFRFDAPDGPIYGYITSEGLRELRLPDPERPIHPYLLHSRPNHILGRRLMQMLGDYFAGIHVDFREMSIDPGFGTPFQRMVWNIAREIPHGQTISYSELAVRVGTPCAFRAVGSALGRNPVCIVVPCHRVIAANGRLGGFTAGLEWKRRLLDLESAGGQMFA
jgi:methylated-DNA-[protein]-cysteine S-methyltransferase